MGGNAAVEQRIDAGYFEKEDQGDVFSIAS